MLVDRLKTQIRANGPLTIADFMRQALMDPQEGYYVRRPVFGLEGDFTTAPEISQMFGELIGIWLASVWMSAGRPNPFQIVELGPGRGTLMVDALRATSKVAGFHDAAQLIFVEQSQALKAMQKEALHKMTGTDGRMKVDWCDSVGQLPQKPTALIANEFFDALPIRQAVFDGHNWAERVVGLTDEGDLTFGLLPDCDVAAWTVGLPPPRAGDILEFSPQCLSVAETLTQLIKDQGFAALIIDYGHARRGYGDSLQAVRNHRFTDVLQDPGFADLTAHVDFALLQAMGQSAGLKTPGPCGQGGFLLAMGLLERAGQLGAGKSNAGQDKIRAEVERLAGPDQMGDLFKVLALTSPGLVVPGFERQQL